MSIITMFKTNKETEVNGIWIEYSPNSDGSIPRFKISRLSSRNRKYARILEQETKPHRRAIELGAMKDDDAENIMVKVFCKSVLLDWENIQEEDGSSIPFTENNAFKLFSDLPDLYDDLNAKARSATLFKDAVMDSEAGN
jgi:hypothetical protein